VTSTVHLRNPTPREVAHVLCAPARAAEPLSGRLRLLLGERLASAAGRVEGRARIDAYAVERDRPGFSTPFSWNARAARRVVGTAAARALATRTSPDALSAAASEIERLCDRAERGLARPGSLGTWLAGEPEHVRALCAVEAATWMAGLLHLVAPIGGVAIGVADAWHQVPGAQLTLHGRRDAAARSAGSTARLGLLRVRDGLPGPCAVDGLLVDGLIDALSGPERPLPSRVVGGWPDAGICLVVEFDEDAARQAARALLECAERMGETSEVARTLVGVA